MAGASTRALIVRYLKSHHRDLTVLADDVVFTSMATGEEYHGRDGVGAMLDHVYRVAFDASAEVRTLVCEPEHAVLEGLLVGRHTGEFAGVAGTGKPVRIPLCVVYDLADGLIRRGRVYFETPVLLQQLGVSSGGVR